MLPDPAKTADAQGWLKRAESDLRAAEVDLVTVPALLGDAAFHCQQAVEKALKAYLTWHDSPFRRTHDLAELGQQCIALDVTLDPLCRRAAQLTAYAWTFRYPGEMEEPTRREVEEALALVREMYGAILRRLPEEAAP